MAEDVGIVMSLYDKVSPTLKNIAGNTKAFDKTMDDLAASLSAYDKAQGTLVTKSASLKKAMEESNQKVSDAKKQWKSLKDETSKGMMDTAIDEQAKIRRELKETEIVLKANEAGYRAIYKSANDAAVAESKAQNRAGRSGGDGLISGLKDAGLTKMLKGSFSQLAGFGLESALGQPTATAVSEILTGVTSGAVMGATMTGTPHGIAIGAVLGGVSGITNAVTGVGAAQDDAFKGYVQENAESQISQRKSDIQAGSGIAAGREADRISFATIFKDKEIAEQYLSDLVDMANTTPFLYDDLTAMSKTLATYGYGADSILPVLQTIGGAGAALGMSTGDMTTVAQALGRMKYSNKTTAEYLNILNDRGIGAVGILADEYGVDQGTMYDMIGKGKIEGGKAVEIILASLTKDYAKAMAEQSETFAGKSSTLEGMEQEMQNAYGEGYNETRNQGIQEQIDWLSGESGEAQEEANRAIGAWQASLENSKEQYIRDAVDAAIESDEYQQAKAAGDAAKMGRLIMEAKVQGQNEYNASEGAQLALESEKEFIAGIRANASLNADYWDAGYEKGQEYSKGIMAGIKDSGVFNAALAGNTSEDYWKDEGGNEYNSGEPGYKDDGGNFHPAACGMRTIPYDNFPILAHQGEELLTASEARSRSVGGGGTQVVVTGNEFSVRGDGDIDAIAAAIADEVELRVLAGRM